MANDDANRAGIARRNKRLALIHLGIAVAVLAAFVVKTTFA